MNRLQYNIKDVSRAIDRYREESSRVEEEKGQIGERVYELETLISKRDEEINEMEGYLEDKERVIA